MHDIHPAPQAHTQRQQSAGISASGPGPPSLYEELYQYNTLEAAYEAAYLYLEDTFDSAEECLINLQNHLIWRSYTPGNVPDMDVVVLEAISMLLKKYSLRPEDTGPEIQTIIDALTLV